MRIKNVILFALAVSAVSVNAQIFINTGSPNVDKYKSGTTTTTTPKVEATAPSVKVTTTPTTTKVTAPTVKATAPSVKVTSPTVKATAPTVKATAPKVKVSTGTTSTTASATYDPSSAKAVQYDGVINEANNNLPPNAEAGKCYARCYIQDQYEFKEEQVIDRPASMRTQSIPATYKTVFDTVITRPASVRFNNVAAIYETITEDIMVSPASQKWVKSTADPSCLSANPEDCQVMCLVEVPAVYKKVSRKVVKTPAYKQEIPVAAEFKIVSRQVIETPARQEQVEIAATYKNVVNKVLVKKGGYSDWREILCGSKLTSYTIRQIQEALSSRGYNIGPAGADNILGADTRTALTKFQSDNNLPIGNLNMETLNALGIKY